MPHVPYRPRPVPTGSMLAPSITAPEGLPADVAPSENKPQVRLQPTNRQVSRRKMSMKSRLSMTDWDVNPHRVLSDMTGM